MKKLYFYISQTLQQMAIKLREILEHATSQGYKSNVVKPLLGLMIIFLLAALGSGIYDLIGLSITFAIVAIFVVVAFMISYFHCLFSNPDLLRSEKYNLEKTAIDKLAIKGDSTTSGKILSPGMDHVVFGSTKEIQPPDDVNTIEK